MKRLRKREPAGLEVMVIQNEEAIHEHVDNEVTEEKSTTTRYIKSKSSQNFEVQLKLA